ncbi:MAG: histidinol-phosphate aminotransferase family protein [Clostridium sp.]|nr:histidinol-phosphate aminotransferase family protein [Clostridium sp.]
MKKINEYKVEQIEGEYIKLNANEINSIFSKREIIDILLDLQLSSFNRYPDSSTKTLRKAYGKFIGYSYKNILAGNGSDQLIGELISVYINKGDKILTLQPDFSMYDFYASLNEGQLIKLDISKEGKFAVKDFISLGKKEKPKIIIFSNPNNPTGYQLPLEEIEMLLNNFNNIKILIDEAYIEFGEQSALNLINKYENLYITRTMSKAWGIASLRIGFIISNENNIKELESFMVPYSVNSISQEIAVKMLSYKKNIMQNIDIIKGERNRLYKAFKELESLHPNEIKFYKSQGNFIFARSKYKKELRKALNDEKIIIRYFKDDSFRITIGKKEENNKLF